LADKIKENPKEFYGYVRSKSRSREGIGPLLDKGGKLHDDKGEICEILNDYFATVFTEENISDMPEAVQKQGSARERSRIELKYFSCTVIEIISNVNEMFLV